MYRQIGALLTYQKHVAGAQRYRSKQTLLVYFNEFADSSLNIMVYCFAKQQYGGNGLPYSRIYLKIIAIVGENGADFAFPSRTLYILVTRRPRRDKIKKIAGARPTLIGLSELLLSG